MMNNYSESYRFRIRYSSLEKQTPLILALDFENTDDSLFQRCNDLISDLGEKLCALKVNFHLFLSLSKKEILQLNKFAREKNLQVIADIKLNDIGNTNKITVNRLCDLRFDAVIMNPIIGITETKSLVDYAHSLNIGVICLLFMSHPGAMEGYGLKKVNANSPYSTFQKSEKHSNKSEFTYLYNLFYNYGKSSNADGFVIGATRTEIIKEISTLDKGEIPIYSPGLLTQGGNITKTINSGADYLIVGRFILNSKSPIQKTDYLLKEIRKNKRFQF